MNHYISSATGHTYNTGLSPTAIDFSIDYVSSSPHVIHTLQALSASDIISIEDSGGTSIFQVASVDGSDNYTLTQLYSSGGGMTPTNTYSAHLGGPLDNFADINRLGATGSDVFVSGTVNLPEVDEMHFDFNIYGPATLVDTSYAAYLFLYKCIWKDITITGGTHQRFQKQDTDLSIFIGCDIDTPHAITGNMSDSLAYYHCTLRDIYWGGTYNNCILLTDPYPGIPYTFHNCVFDTVTISAAEATFHNCTFKNCTISSAKVITQSLLVSCTGSTVTYADNNAFYSSTTFGTNQLSLATNPLGADYEVTNFNLVRGQLEPTTLNPFGATQPVSLGEYGPAPILHLKLNEASGTTLLDSSGNGFNGTSDAPRVSDASYTGFTYALDISNTYTATVARNTSWMLPVTGDFTVACRVKFDALADVAFFAHDDGSGAVPKWIFGYNSGKVWFHTASATPINYTYTPTTGVWYHFAVVRTGTNYKLFIDGTEIEAAGTASGPASIGSPTTASLTIGSAETSFYLNGKLSDIRIYHQVLDPNTLQQVYTNGTYVIPSGGSVPRIIGG